MLRIITAFLVVPLVHPFVPSHVTHASRPSFFHASTALNCEAQANSTSMLSLKSSIFAACAASDRGFAASPADRANIERLLADLVDFSERSPSDAVEPTFGLSEGDESAPLKACWR